MEQLKGKVIIAGAGPGDPGLITVRAAVALQKADVILTDRLVNKEIISQYASASALVVEVGKQGGKLHSTPQETINTLLLQYALQGKTVVRLKGGDVSLFANVLDELSTLHAHSIPFEIIPGITAASGASAYTGIPLTARGYAAGLRILTYYHSDVINEKEWKHIARSSDTLVFYMSAQILQDLHQQLVHHGMTPETPMAIVEQATTASQKVTLVKLEDVSKVAVDEIRTPALVIIGKVVELHQQFAWFDAQKPGTAAFAELPPQTISSILQQTLI